VRRVLLVEDEGLIRLVIAEILRDEGFDVVEAWNGDEAVSLLDGVNRFDVLFTDVQMPGKLDGIDVALYARNRDPTIPVLVVSGVAAKRVMSRLNVLEPPAVFVDKPYSPQEIVETVRRLGGTR
jgi:CheY-like chemotaxis protein